MQKPDPVFTSQPGCRVVRGPGTHTEHRAILLRPKAVITHEQMAMLEDSPPSTLFSQTCYLQRSELSLHCFTSIIVHSKWGDGRMALQLEI